MDQITIDIIAETIGDKELYKWILAIDDSVIASDEFLYGSRIEAVKKAQKKLYAWIQAQE